MKLRWVSAVLLAVSIFPAMSWAEDSFLTGGGLLQACEEGDPLCPGYIRGVFEVGGYLGQAMGGGAELHVFPGAWEACMPAEVTIGQLQGAVRDWLKEHPDKLHFSAVSLIGHALHEAFPCG